MCLLITYKMPDIFALTVEVRSWEVSKVNEVKREGDTRDENILMVLSAEVTLAPQQADSVPLH